MIFVSDIELFEKVQSIRAKTPSVQSVYTFNTIKDANHWEELLHVGNEDDLKNLQQSKNSINPEELCTILYTSGTTGFPKGVMLSHHNILDNVRNSEEVFDPIGTENDRALSFLPLNHIFERMVSYIYIFNGVSIYYAESLDTIGENLKEVKPTVFSTVPRLLEKVYEKIIAKGREQKGIKKALFFWAVALGSKFESDRNMGVWYNLQLAIANKIIFSKRRCYS
jgi:long-chain acyl-CoA synthetase